MRRTWAALTYEAASGNVAWVPGVLAMSIHLVLTMLNTARTNKNLREYVRGR